MSYTIAITECPYSGQKVSLDRMGNKFVVCYIISAKGLYSVTDRKNLLK